MKYKAVVFDLDGTLVHTKPEYRYLLVRNTLNELGSKYTKKFIDKFWFESERDLIIKKRFKLKPELFWESFRKKDTIELRKDFTKVYEDVSFISELRKKNYKTGIFTGAPDPIASLEVDMVGRYNFDAVIIPQYSNGFKPKPHPQGLEECLDLLRVKNTEAIYVGNGEEDIKTAKNANVLDVLLIRGEYEFQNVNPSIKINSLYDLREILGY
jgi:pyrophosphatase PpaX